jgi:hypothetical protein
MIVPALRRESRVQQDEDEQEYLMGASIRAPRGQRLITSTAITTSTVATAIPAAQIIGKTRTSATLASSRPEAQMKKSKNYDNHESCYNPLLFC